MEHTSPVGVLQRLRNHGAVSVAIGTLLEGYERAYVRWMEGARLSTDPDEAFLGIFEALNWAVVVDDRLRDRDGGSWAGGGAVGAVVAGFRYARNAVHHDWSEVLDVHQGVTLPTPLPTGLFDWCWLDKIASTRRRGETQYQATLAGRPVRFTLESLRDLYRRALSSGTPSTSL